MPKADRPKKLKGTIGNRPPLTGYPHRTILPKKKSVHPTDRDPKNFSTR